MEENNVPEQPPVSYHFAVSFFIDRAVSPVDAAFQSIGGLCSGVETLEIREGGENFYTHTLPKRVVHDNLVLKRGMIKDCQLTQEFMKVVNSLEINLANIQINPLSKDGQPDFGGWVVHNAYLVRWAVEDMDAFNNNIIIQTMEFAYNRLEYI